MKMRNGSSGTTLLEILVAMIIIGVVASGIMTAFVFSRRVTLRSGSELSGMGLVEEISEQLRAAPINGLTLNPGVYVDTHMLSTARPPGAVPLAALDLPAAFQTRYQTNLGRTPAATWADHADGRVLVVEDADHPAALPPTVAVDLDEDGQKGISFDGVTTALRRVRVRVRFTTPSVQ